MDMRKKKQLFLIGGIALLALVAVIVLAATLGGSGAKRYEKHYDAAEAAYLRRDYETALNEIGKAVEAEQTEEAYLLMADVYYAMGDTEQAIQVLYLGYSRVGGSAIDDMLSRLKREASGEDANIPSPLGGDGVTVAGKTFAADTTSVVLSGKNLSDSDFAALCALTGLESLGVSDNAISDLSPAAALGQLRTLDISGNRINDLTALSGLRGLKILYIDGNPIRDLTPLYSLGSLQTLSMKNIDVSAEALDELREAIPGCSVFADVGEKAPADITLGGKTFRSDVTELNLGNLDLTDISALSECRDLVKLDLRDNKITDISPLVDLQNLEWLCLWGNEVEDVTPLMSLTKLTYLDLDANNIGGITALEYLIGLEELWLNNNPVKRFSALERLTGLTRLGLKNTGLKDDDLELLYGLEELKELNLDDNENLSANKVEELREKLPKCTVTASELLWVVELGGVKYTSDATEIDASGKGVADLTGLEHFTKLETLNLDNNSVSDLSPLYELKQLKSVSLRNNGLSKEAVAALQAKLPGCVIVGDAPRWDEIYAEFLSSGAYLRQGQTYYAGGEHPAAAALRDLDGDGTPELVISNGSDVEADAASYIYVYWDGAARYLGAIGSRINAFRYPASNAYPGLYQLSGNMDYYTGYYYDIRDGELVSELVLEITTILDEATVTPKTGDEALFDACDRATEAMPTYTPAEIGAMGFAAFAARYGF